ncbi:uncharacterized protein LOC131658983 [Vicia villosa]|uniref:uncharacterized protein LOC131658983 n=1 Tax=Vicia villosa TaxID=3911 RepID=UPI00273AD9EB|nr:uncharacterized protein LOC131658983 [Vicia villosa]
MVMESEYSDLQDMMLQAGLSEMDSCGDYFTWCNRHTVDPIHSRIDRLVGNVDWFTTYSDLTLKILPLNVLDHALLLLTDRNQIKRASRFKFYNCVNDLPGYKDVVSNRWNKPLEGSTMFTLWGKLQRLKPELKQFSKGLTNMEQARKDLEQAQIDLSLNNMDGSRISKVKSCTEEVIGLHDLEEQMLIQRSKIDWLRLSDDNISYFHASIKAKHKRKSMNMLKKPDGSMVSEQSSIMSEVMHFYQQLMGSKDDTLKHVDIEAMRIGKQASPSQREYLTSIVTEKEIWNTLKGIGDLKAPGIDGYGTKIFKASWNTIKKDVIVAVQEFFVKGKLYKAFNSTIVTLIPKHEHANEVKDVRPIAGCTTFFKIISKVLTNRLGNVLPDIIHQSQTAFMKGRVIQNHILLAFELMRGYDRKGGTPRCMLQINLQKA